MTAAGTETRGQETGKSRWTVERETQRLKKRVSFMLSELFISSCFDVEATWPSYCPTYQSLSLCCNVEVNSGHFFTFILFLFFFLSLNLLVFLFYHSHPHSLLNPHQLTFPLLSTLHHSQSITCTLALH